MYMQGFYKILRLAAGIGPLIFLCHSGLRRRGRVASDFKGKAVNSQVDEKGQTCGKAILSESPETSGHREESNKPALEISPSATLNSYMPR